MRCRNKDIAHTEKRKSIIKVKIMGRFRGVKLKNQPKKTMAKIKVSVMARDKAPRSRLKGVQTLYSIIRLVVPVRITAMVENCSWENPR